MVLESELAGKAQFDRTFWNYLLKLLTAMNINNRFVVTSCSNPTSGTEDFQGWPVFSMLCSAICAVHMQLQRSILEGMCDHLPITVV